MSKLEPVDKRYATPHEADLRKQWEKDLKAYKKPVRTDALAPRYSKLLMSRDTETSLGYILFVDGKQKSVVDAAACEFLFYDPEPMRKATIPLKTVAGFHVYYKHDAYWYGVPKHFDTLADAMPYLQGGNRVLVEYRITQKQITL